MLRQILSAIGRAIGLALAFIGNVFDRILIGCGLAPSVPPVDPSAELDEIAQEAAEADRIEELAMVRRWATVRLYRRAFDYPPGRIGDWLAALNDDDAGRVAAASGAGALQAHLDGVSHWPDLPPSRATHDTRHWRSDHTPSRTASAKPPNRRAGTYGSRCGRDANLGISEGRSQVRLGPAVRKHRPSQAAGRLIERARASCTLMTSPSIRRIRSTTAAGARSPAAIETVAKPTAKNACAVKRCGSKSAIGLFLTVGDHNLYY